MRINPGANVARTTVAETISGVWTHTANLKAAGVLFTGNRIDLFELVGAGNSAVRVRVVGDTNVRFVVDAAGVHAWGDGSGVTDVGLSRRSAGVLWSQGQHDFTGTVKMDGPLRLSQWDPPQITGNADDFAIGTVVVLRLDASAAWDITGFAGGVAGRVIILMNVAGFTITLKHNNAGSVVANRMLLTGSADIAVDQYDTIMLCYDGDSSRWRVMAAAV